MRNKGLTLRLIISVLAISTVLLTAMISVFSALQVSKASLSASYLENNYQYAKKLTLNTQDFLLTMERNLQAIATQAKNQTPQQIQEHLSQSSEAFLRDFNSVVVADQNRYIKALTPATTGVAVGTQLISNQSKQAVSLKRPLISEPYRAVSGRLIVLISYPIFDSAGMYQGFAGGTIYLEENNVLSRILKDHFYKNGSYVYVVDQTGHLIFHPDKQRLGESVLINGLAKQVLAGASGSQLYINSKGNPFFAGYAYEPNSGWGIVSQTPTSVIEQPAHELIVHMMLQALPFLLLILFLAWIIANRIAKPLYELAKFSEEFSLHMGKNPMNPPVITSAIYEVQQLYQSTRMSTQNITNHLNQLQVEVRTDGLTRLPNRRTFDLVMEEWISNNIPFSLILIDIDHFKNVNDTYGHMTGDEVLKFFAQTMMSLLREGDLCFRYGGEEFCILAPYGDHEVAETIAERLRKKLESTQSPTGTAISISLGIALFPEHEKDGKKLIALADEALYLSKAEGRNRTTLFSAERCNVDL